VSRSGSFAYREVGKGREQERKLCAFFKCIWARADTISEKKNHGLF